MRGALPPDNGALRSGGIIPARAGSTYCSPRNSASSWDHPRSCGEHWMRTAACRISLGSSPLVRGAPRPEAQRRCARGIIPARAGSTNHPEAISTPGWDHPRSCGEHYFRCRRVANREGIIPARAGSTARRPSPRHAIWDHPRSCGEHMRSARLASFSQGSSPLVRGAPHDPPVEVLGTGIIPARAGSTCARQARTGSGRDHPRSCGEHCNRDGRDTRLEGSSPLVRRARTASNRSSLALRIIPARAGSTIASSASTRQSKDHPRSCGEHP